MPKRLYVIFTLIVAVTTVLIIFTPQSQIGYANNILQKDLLVIDNLVGHVSDEENIAEWLRVRQNTKNLTALGRFLFLGEEPKIIDASKKYKILVWKYGKFIENRHLKNFSNKKKDPFKNCPVKNCDITYNEKNTENADIVIFHMHRMQNPQDLPSGVRNPNQIWAFLTDESPYNTFLSSGTKLKEYDGVFNWSMTYRMDSDIPVPYGRTVVKKQQKEPFELVLNKRRDVLIAVLGSNCGGNNHRWKYVKELQKYIKVDIYGGCGPLKSCPGHFKADCPIINKYLFYLSFENSNCEEYITEKLWWNGYEKNSIPIVMGASPESYKKMLPLNSYINVEDFASPAVLAEYIYSLNRTEEFKEYYRWKRNFDVYNEHGYFQSESFHYCRICQALNYNDKKSKTYKNLDDFWSVKRDCHPAWDS